MGAAEACAWALGYRPFYEQTFDVLDANGIHHTHQGRPDHPYCYNGIPKSPTKGLIICQDWDKAQEIFTSEEDGIGRGKLFKFLPDRRRNDDGKSPGIIKTSRTSTGAISLLKVRSKWGGVSSIYLDTVRSYKSDAMGQESSNWDWIMVDEPCPEGMWKAASRGLIDSGGKAWFNCTPLRERWINDMFIPGTRTKLKQQEENVFEINGAERWVMVGSMHDNPHLRSSAKKEYIASLTAEEIATRVEGKPAHYQGLIYPQFDYDRHVLYKMPSNWKDAITPPSSYYIRRSIDPHPKTPHAVLYAATAPTGEVYIYAEIFQKLLAPELCAEMHFIDQGREITSAPCDWYAFEENNNDGRCMADDFENAGIEIHKADRCLSAGIMAVQAALARPGFIYVSAQCERFLYEIDCYAWDETKEKPIDSNDHMMENFYRLVLEGLDYETPPHLRSNYSGKHVAPVDAKILTMDYDLPTPQEETPMSLPQPTGWHRDLV
jgi:hypothetical protein